MNNLPTFQYFGNYVYDHIPYFTLLVAALILISFVVALT